MSMHKIIYERRRALALTQEQVAEYMGVSAQAVHKWEKGATFPDITLVPKLARLLKVDLNTLFCFRETLSKQEIQQLQEAVIQEIADRGIDAGIALAEKTLREYPDCGALLEGMAVAVQGSLIMSEVQIPDREAYQAFVTACYERAMGCGDEEVKNRAGFMAASQYLGSGDYEKAGQVLERLPEPCQLNKYLLLSELFQKQGQAEEAVKLLEKMLLQAANNSMAIFSRLVDAELLRGEEAKARKIAKKAEEAAAAYDCWGYMGLIGMESVARKRKDVAGSLALLKQMLEAAQEPWRMHQSPLYDLLYEKVGRKEDISVSEKVLPALLTMLESDPEYDFLREQKEFQELLDAYRV